MILDGKYNSTKYADFLKRFIHNTERQIFLVVYGHPAHCSKNVEELFKSTKGKFRLFILPPYSPDLNPDGLVWNNLKSHRIGRKIVIS